MEILMNDDRNLLELRNISKTFPGVKALDRVSFQIKPGIVHALMGENGAGKSTLMKCIFGIYRQDEGEIFLNGNLLKIESPRQALDSEIAMIHQELQPLRTRSAMENIWVGRISFCRFLGVHWVDDQKMLKDTKSLFEELGNNKYHCKQDLWFYIVVSRPCAQCGFYYLHMILWIPGIYPYGSDPP